MEEKIKSITKVVCNLIKKSMNLKCELDYEDSDDPCSIITIMEIDRCICINEETFRVHKESGGFFSVGEYSFPDNVDKCGDEILVELQNSKSW